MVIRREDIKQLNELYNKLYGQLTLNEFINGYYKDPYMLEDMTNDYLQFLVAYHKILKCFRDSKILSQEDYENYFQHPWEFSMKSILGSLLERGQDRPPATDFRKNQLLWLSKLDELLKPLGNQLESFGIETPEDLNAIQEYPKQISQIPTTPKSVEQKTNQLGQHIIDKYWSPFFSKIFIIEEFIWAYEMPSSSNGNQPDIGILVSELKLYAECFVRSLGIIPDTIRLFKTRFNEKKYKLRTSIYWRNIPRVKQYLQKIKSDSTAVETIYEIGEWGYTFGVQKKESIVLPFRPSQI